MGRCTHRRVADVPLVYLQAPPVQPLKAIRLHGADRGVRRCTEAQVQRSYVPLCIFGRMCAYSSAPTCVWGRGRKERKQYQGRWQPVSAIQRFWVFTWGVKGREVVGKGAWVRGRHLGVIAMTEHGGTIGTWYYATGVPARRKLTLPTTYRPNLHGG